MRLALLFLVMVVSHIIETSAFAARLAGVRTGRPALAHSLYNVLALGSRATNVLSGALLGTLADVAVAGEQTSRLLVSYRVALLAATAGTLVAGLLVPTLSRVLTVAIAAYEQRQSLPRVVVRGASVRGMWRVRQELTQPRLAGVIEARRSPFPKRFLIISVLVMAVYTVSNFAALYASALVPEGVRTATSLSPVLTGGGVVLMTFFIEPVAALINDEALRGERPLRDATYIVIWQVGARLAGTILAQALLVPAALLLAQITRWLI